MKNDVIKEAEKIAIGALNMNEALRLSMEYIADFTYKLLKHYRAGDFDSNEKLKLALNLLSCFCKAVSNTIDITLIELEKREKK